MKFRNRKPKEVQADLVLNDDAVAAPKLSAWEKFRRGFKAQNGWLFVAPALILMLLFSFYPIVTAFINAFKNDLDQNGIYNGWGFENFGHVFRGDTGMAGANFWQCLVNTLIFTLVSVPLSTLLALIISVALNSIKAVQKAYQTILFLPYLTNSLAMGAVFTIFFAVIHTGNGTNWGLVNGLLGTEVEWLGLGNNWKIGSINIPWAKYIVLIIYEVWTGLPFKILILFSAMQSIDKQYYDAAKVDGASRWTTLWKITAPMVMPQISYLLVTGIMGGMKQYTAVVGLFGSNMGNAYDMGTVVGYIYRYVEGGTPKYGYAYAASLILFVIIMIITFFNNKITRRKTTFK